ncbi:hypothetical protein VDGL01_11648 [Verticillium dahliae]
MTQDQAACAPAGQHPMAVAPQASGSEKDAPIQNTGVADTEMTDLAPADLSKLSIKVWVDGEMRDYSRTIDMDKPTVEKHMALLDSKGYKLLNVNGRCMKPKMVYSEAVKTGLNLVIITLETAIDHNVLSAIKQCLRTEKNIRQQKRKLAERVI